MSIWLIIILSFYCGVSYTLGILVMAISDRKITNRNYFDLIFTPIWIIFLLPYQFYFKKKI